MKLFNVEVMDDAEMESVMVVAKSEKEALELVYKMDWACYIGSWAHEISSVNGYRIDLVKIDN